MQIVIDTDEDLYNHIKNSYIVCEGMRTGKSFLGAVYNAIANGKPLPKGHGRLIDADKLQHEINNDKREAFSKHEVWLLLSAFYDNLLTIIEADKAESEVVNENSNRYTR